MIVGAISPLSLYFLIKKKWRDQDFQASAMEAGLTQLIPPAMQVEGKAREKATPIGMTFKHSHLF